MLNEYCLNDKSNKKNQMNDKLLEREMLNNFIKNPFLNSNYLDDIMTQDKFLKPQHNYQINRMA